jgi:hypothetical protein
MIGWLKKRRLKAKLQEKQELPVGLPAFHAWSNRIIAGGGLPATEESQKYTLANMLLNLSPTTAFETDVYFIHALRKFAINQVADAYRKEVYANRKAQGDGTNAEGVAPQRV